MHLIVRFSMPEKILKFEQKWLHKYCLSDKYYPVAADATDVMNFQARHCEHCLTKIRKPVQTGYIVEDSWHKAGENIAT
jgi:uncharacterized protein YfaT (DUF1175 family)